MPVPVSVPRPRRRLVAARSAFAMPKSAITACPPERSTFSGLRSRWTTPCECAYASASATSRSEPHRLRHRQRARARRVAERLPVDVRHHVVEQPVSLAGVVDTEDVRMGELRGDSDLPEEALGADRRRRARGRAPSPRRGARGGGRARGRPWPCRRAELALDGVAAGESGAPASRRWSPVITQRRAV